MSKKTDFDQGSAVSNLARRAGEMTANGIRASSNAITRHEESIANGAESIVRIAGKGVGLAGQGVAISAKALQSGLRNNTAHAADAARIAVSGSTDAGLLRKGFGHLLWAATRTVGKVVEVTAGGAALAGQGISAAGRATSHSSSAIGGSVGGAVRGSVEVTSNAVDSVALSALRIDEMRTELKRLGVLDAQSSRLRLQAIEAAQTGRRKTQLLDLLVIGGMSLGEMVRDPSKVPADVQQAFNLAYPGLAMNESFSDAVSRMDASQLVGFVSGVKGKLFELNLVEQMNGGGLPDGYHAHLAASATQPGWDLRVAGPDDQTVEFLQAKATMSANYIQEALHRYPDIDVTTTSEVHAQMLARGLAEHVHNSGISEVALQTKVELAAHGAHGLDLGDLAPSSIGLAVIALSVFMGKGGNLREMGSEFGSRAGRTAVSSIGAKAVMAVTQTWWLGLIVGVGSGWLANRGRDKREIYGQLDEALKFMRRKNQIVLDLS